MTKLNVPALIKAVVKNTIPELSDEKIVKEAYAAQAKTYDMPAESVSDPVKEEHVELYKGYVAALNKCSAAVDAASSGPAEKFRQVKRDEVYNLNAVYLHELYFANSFDPVSEIFEDSLACMRLTRDWGTFENWQHEFSLCALSAREGWAVTGYSTFLKKYINVFIDSHDANIPIGFYPVIVVDMWTHARKDYKNDVSTYFVTQMRELNWVVIEERFQRANKIAEAVK